jgi:hypothetical protein
MIYISIFILLKDNGDVSPQNLVANVFVLGYCMLRQLVFVTFKSQANSQNIVYRQAIVAGRNMWLEDMTASTFS